MPWRSDAWARDPAGALTLRRLAALAALAGRLFLVFAARGSSGLTAAAGDGQEDARLAAVLLLGALGLGGAGGLGLDALRREALLECRHEVDDVARLLRGRTLLARQALHLRLDHLLERVLVAVAEFLRLPSALEAIQDLLG